MPTETDAASSPPLLPTPRPTLRDLAVLCRLPAVFTAVADPIAGAAVALGGSEVRFGPVVSHLDAPILLASLASGCLYLFGMVQNDLTDREEDAAVGKRRPIPEGRVSVGAATSFGRCLLATGLLLAGCVAILTDGFWTVGTAMLLAATISLYNCVLKETIFGPLAMASCRTLNMLLGVAVVADAFAPFNMSTWLSLGGYWVPVGLGVYVAGLTLFARDETGIPNPTYLAMGYVAALGGIVLIALGLWNLRATFSAGLALTVVAITISVRCLAAIRSRRAKQIGPAIGWMILMIIPIDSIIVLA